MAPLNLKLSPRRISLVLASAALLVGGCSRDKFGRFDPAPIDPVLRDPIPDAAATARAFDASTFHYPSGQVVSFPVYYTTYETRPKFLESDLAYGLATPGLFLVDVALFPLRFVTQPPWTLVVYQGSQYGPSMTVAPPLPGNLPPGDKTEIIGNPVFAAPAEQ